MYIAGFSINVLTMLAVVLSVGLVVDDAIVMTENIYILSLIHIFLLWNRETFRGNKLYFCKGVPVYGRAVALRMEDGRHRETLRF